MRATLAFLLAALLAAFASIGPAGAQSDVDVRESSARSDFPNGIVFTLEAASSAGFDDVRLVYEIAPDGVRATATADCTGGTLVSCTYELGRSQRNLLIPGAEVTYFWRITTAGETQATEPQLIVYEDDRFEWRTVSDGNLTLWWYSGSQDAAERVLAAGRETLDGIGTLLQTDVSFPVKIFYYASASDMEAAIIPSSVEGIVTAGVVSFSDTAMVSGSAPDEIARHEIAHIVIREAVRGPLGGVPDWLNEGTSVFAQNQPLSGQSRALEAAIQSGDVFSVRSLSSSSSGARPENVSLFYGQSYSLVAFLVESYGPEQFAELFQTFKAGATTAGALEQVYGFDQDGLENAWRDSVGLGPRQAPTLEPDRTDPAPGSGDDSASTTVVIAVVALAALFAVVLLGAGAIVLRRGR
ncbi:MAG: hypothetical protein IIC26_02210 [Chloroflexi bacterium]|nr:hypothetical protein [Chloroflexota bacterium]